MFTGWLWLLHIRAMDMQENLCPLVKHLHGKVNLPPYGWIRLVRTQETNNFMSKEFTPDWGMYISRTKVNTHFTVMN